MVIQQYQDPSVNQALKFGFWYQEHRHEFARAALGALIAVNALFWAYALYGAGTLVVGMRGDERLYAELVGAPSDVVALHQSFAPEELVVEHVAALASASEQSEASALRADFLALVSNPNPGWIARVAYSFRWGGGETELREGIVLPESEAYLASFGALVSGVPADSELAADVAWERVRDPSVLVRPAGVLQSITVETSEAAARAGVTDMRAVVANESPYTVITPSLILVATRFSGEPLAAWLHMETIASGERITTQRRFARSLPPSLEVSVYPVFEFFDDGAYQLRGSGFTPL
ncbi:MAG: hypothetical protein AAB671_01630 [Patescibacteria group bacterium]